VTVSVPATVPITPEGFEQLCGELDRLRTEERPRLSGLLLEARSDGALDDNAALVELLEEQAWVDRRIATLEAHLAAVEIAFPTRDGPAAVGSLVRARDTSTGEISDYHLVGPIEGDPEKGRVSIAAPIGRALLGRKRGARVQVETPRGAVTLDLLDVAAAAPARAAA
jgi:transcription elongation factor GreA